MNDKRMEDTYPDLSQKVIWFEISGAPAERGGILMEYVEFRSLAGRMFVVGRMLESDVSGWLSGVEAAIAWDAVVHYLVFKSRDDYAQRSTTHKPSLRERVFSR
jgi:hypothetical protein